MLHQTLRKQSSSHPSSEVQTCGEHACWLAGDVKEGLTAHFVSSFDDVFKVALQ